MDRLKVLREKKLRLIAEARAITTAADADSGRDLTEDETAAHAALVARVTVLNADIKTEETLQAAERDMPVLVISDNADIRGGEDLALADPTHGFESSGHFFMAVARGSVPQAKPDERLRYLADVPGTSYAQGGAGADGGFLIPPEFSGRIRGYALEEGALLPLTQNDQVLGNSMSFPVSEQTPWGSTGARCFWEGEAQTANKSKPVLESRDLRLRRLLGLVPATNDIIDDAALMSTWLPRQLGVSIRWKTNEAIVNGNGTGQPEGFINGGNIIEQAKETSQTADTINVTNIAKMYGRCLGVINAVWLVNPDAFHQLVVMTLGDHPIFIPRDGGGKVSPMSGFLFGLPLLLSDTCQTVGDAGDIYLANLRDGYQTITKQGGISFATSMHLWFDYDMMAFRAVFRVDGKTLNRAVVTPPHSTITRSHFIRLAART